MEGTSRAPSARLLILIHPVLLQTFWDATGQLWATGGLAGKYAGLFISTAGLGGGQESTAIAALSVLTHHGITYVPLGYASAFAQLTNLSEVHGGECPFPVHRAPARTRRA